MSSEKPQPARAWGIPARQMTLSGEPYRAPATGPMIGPNTPGTEFLSESGKRGRVFDLLPKPPPSPKDEKDEGKREKK